jgi:hypothetical protein
MSDPFPDPLSNVFGDKAAELRAHEIPSKLAGAPPPQLQHMQHMQHMHQVLSLSPDPDTGHPDTGRGRCLAPPAPGSLLPASYAEEEDMC